MKLSYNGEKELYDCAVAIAVLGCIAFVAALAALGLSILMDGQTMILIIVGGVSAVFAFGCIVAEGVYTSKYIYAASYENIGEVPKHSGAQKYIKNSLKDLYEELYKKEGVSEQIPSWSKIEELIDNSNSKDNFFSYASLWGGNSASDRKFYVDNDVIYGCVNGVEYPLALTKFKGDKYTPKVRICWYDTEDSTFECDNFKTEETDAICNFAENGFTLTEYILDGKDTVEGETYLIKGFPAAYYKIGDDSRKQNSDPTKDDKHHKVSAKACTKAAKKSGSKNPDKYDLFYVSDRKPSSYEDFEEYCSSHSDVCNYRYETSFSYIRERLNKGFKEVNLGKSPKDVKSYYKGRSKHYANEILYNSSSLYGVALANLIIQIFGIIFWAVGRFIGMILGGGDDGKSEGEA